MAAEREAGHRTEEEVARLLRELEADRDLYSLEVDGIAAWRLVRFRAAMIMRRLPRAGRGIGDRWRRLGVMILRAAATLKSLLFPRSVDIVAKTYSSALTERDGELFRDVYFDDLLGSAGPGAKIEGLNNPDLWRRYRHARMPVALTTDAVELTAMVLAFVTPWTVRFAADDVASALGDHPELGVIGRGQLRRIFGSFYWQRRLYRRLLARMGARVVLTTNTNEFSIVAAAHDIGIPTVELQHGVFTRNHPDLLPPWVEGSADRLILPDRVFLYGDHWLEELRGNGIYREQLRTVGNVRIDRYRTHRALATGSTTGSPSVLVTTQGIDREALIEFLDEAARADSAEGVTWYVRLHPIHDPSKAPYLQRLGDLSTVHVLAASEKPSTFDLLTTVDMHVSVASAVHYDAIGLGVPTVVIPLAGHELMRPLLAAGHATLARRPSMLGELVRYARMAGVPPEVSGRYFAPGAAAAVARELSGLIGHDAEVRSVAQPCSGAV